MNIRHVITQPTRENIREMSDLPTEGPGGFYAPTNNLRWINGAPIAAEDMLALMGGFIGSKYLYQLWTHPRSREFPDVWVRIPTENL